MPKQQFIKQGTAKIASLSGWTGTATVQMLTEEFVDGRKFAVRVNVPLFFPKLKRFLCFKYESGEWEQKGVYPQYLLPSNSNFPVGKSNLPQWHTRKVANFLYKAATTTESFPPICGGAPSAI